MGSLSDVYENVMLDALFGDGRATGMPATVYVGLYTVAPTDAGGGTQVSGGSYARVAVTNNTVNWPNAAGGVKANGTLILFPAATGSWGTVVAWGIFTALTLGTMIVYGDVTPNVAVASGQQPFFAVGEIDFTGA